jgi:hypothetical protein
VGALRDLLPLALRRVARRITRSRRSGLDALGGLGLRSLSGSDLVGLGAGSDLSGRLLGLVGLVSRLRSSDVISRRGDSHAAAFQAVAAP